MRHKSKTRPWIVASVGAASLASIIGLILVRWKWSASVGQDEEEESPDVPLDGGVNA